MVKNTFSRLNALLFFLAVFSLAPAADYYFRVDDLKAELTIQRDGSVDIRYAITFSPEAGSHPIDIVDIGMPNERYDKDTARAWLDGRELTVIKDSEYVHPGVEVHLDGQQIMPGTTARLEFQIKVAGMVFQDSADNAYAALEFKSTWFERKYVSGTTGQLEIQINLPAGTGPEQARYHAFGRADYRPSDSFFKDDRVSYVWRWPGQPATVPYAAGASFPKNLVAAVSVPEKKNLGRSFLVMAAAFLGFVLSLAPFWIVVLIIILAVRSGRNRLKAYLPPRIGIESGGIKRGLTPAEAALLQELPLPRVLLLIIFGLLKKDVLAVKEVADKDFRYTLNKKEGFEPLAYEKEFIAAIDADQRLNRSSLRPLLTNMIKELQGKMSGFSRRETNMYYRSIMNKAWDQVENAAPEKLPAELAESLEWLATDEQFEEKLGPYANAGVFPPGRDLFWYHRFPQRAPAAGGAVPGQGYGQAVKGAAGRFVQSLQVFSAALVGDAATFTSAVTQVTNPPPVSTSSGSSSHGGSSCACACACAGCACACAGGGR